MCLICIELQKEKMTYVEAMNNVDEMRSQLGDHAKEVDDLIVERALKEFDKLLQDAEPFVDPPKLVDELTDEEYLRRNMLRALDFDDEPLELELEDIPTTSW